MPHCVVGVAVAAMALLCVQAMGLYVPHDRCAAYGPDYSWCHVVQDSRQVVSFILGAWVRGLRPGLLVVPRGAGLEASGQFHSRRLGVQLRRRRQAAGPKLLVLDLHVLRLVTEGRP